MYVKLFVDITDMGPHRENADHERIGDILECAAIDQKSEDFFFPGGEVVV